MSDASESTRPTTAPHSAAPDAPDTSKLLAFLREHVPSQSGAGDDFSVQRLPFGYSNMTYRVRYDGRDLVLRRPPVGANVKSGHDMGREFRVLSALVPIYPHVPRPLAYCDDESVFGAPFYLMEYVDGVILRRPLPDGLTLDPTTMRRISEAFIDNLVAIHALDWTSGDLNGLGHPDGYVQRQISGWRERYARARTDDIVELERVETWLSTHMPAQRYSALIHNDYKYDNLIFDSHDVSQIRAVLDWEMATLGDPLMDLGVMLAYWVDADDSAAWRGTSATDGLTTLPGNLTRAELVARYAARSGRDLGDVVYYFVYGLYKNTVIAQQIHARYVKGLLPDPRFGRFLPIIQTLATTAARAIDANRIDHLS